MAREPVAHRLRRCSASSAAAAASSTSRASIDSRCTVQLSSASANARARVVVEIEREEGRLARVSAIVAAQRELEPVTQRVDARRRVATGARLGEREPQQQRVGRRRVFEQTR